MPVRQNVRRFVIASVGLLACASGIWAAGRAGFSNLLYQEGIKSGRPGLVSKAVAITPSDPQAHYTQAWTLAREGQIAGATNEFEKAVALRPSDYVLWLDLGNARAQARNHDGALAAFREAARLAPYYARPPWDTGQFLLRVGRRDEAFDELRLAMASRPTLLPEVTELAWKTYGGDVSAVQRAIQPQTNQDRFLLARFVARQGKVDEAMQLFRAASQISDAARFAFLRELLEAKQFKGAYEVWSSGPEQAVSIHGPATVTDGSFESQISPEDPGFGWQLALQVPEISISLDADSPRAGAHSLQVRFSGNAQASTQIVKQLVLVSPQTRYRLSFATRSEKLVTGGPPFVSVTDAGSNDGNPLAQSQLVATGTADWRDYTVEFTTKDTTNAIEIGVQRQSCTSDPCPIFGSIWLDAFSLQKL